ncbi:Retrotransposon Polyprotein [Phytophthora megakarya]|uniref:Retrotransposon Polyprotein n=1 Tax=Phytophthora megakarya TaxID=4795 RepID=A0A225VSP7_9STRA|nr:Retrotransposon Polyprotein [Phytophthora megakarya]
MAPQFEMRNGALMRRVHLRARAGPDNTKLAPVIPLKFIETYDTMRTGPVGKMMLLSTYGAVISVMVEKVREPVECSECQSRTYLDHFLWSLWTPLEMRNGVLMRPVHLRARAGPANTKLVPVKPLRFIETVLYYCHGDLMSAHLGKTKMLEKVRHYAYWPGWKKDVAEYVRCCHICHCGKGSRPWRAGRMQRMPVKDLSGPFSLVVVDAIVPLPTPDRGNKYILVFVDYFTRWAEAFAIQALDFITFVNVMIDGVICRHGVPEQLLSDRGTNFTSELARSLYQTLGIKKLFGVAYHPQTQGLVERFNGTLLGMLRLFVHETQTDWDVYLPRVVTSYHESLGDTPFFSLYGRDPKLTLDLAFLNTTKDWKSNEVAIYRRQLYKSLHDSR